jgi:UDP-glucose:(heptosyl)LPS alpha-1,3-glucosyltransferase
MLPVRSCDVYHPHAGLAAEGVASGHAKYDPGLKRLLAAGANRLNRKRRMFARVERDLLERADGEGGGPVVLCLSEYVKGTVRRHYDLPEQRLATLFNAVDLGKFDPAREPDAGAGVRRRLGIGPDRVVALMVAQDFERKGLREAILALPRVRPEPPTLLVVGRGRTARYERLAKELGVADRVVFAGPTADVYSYYQAADLFVLPTRHDPCSLVVLEALAMGVPVVSTTFNGACEVMTDGVHGRVLRDPADVGALATAMRHLLDEQTRRAAGEACLALRPRLSYDAHVETLLGVYGRVGRRQ